MSQPRIRTEQPADAPGIAHLIAEAFRPLPESDGSEVAIVDKLRSAHALTLSLVATDPDGQIIGHAAVSPVDIREGWYGLGPVSVHPEMQGRGVGGRLITEALDRLRASGAGGIVVLGEPAYYSRFGFQVVPGLTYPHAPVEFFMALLLGDAHFPTGEVSYHRAFGS